MTILEAMELMRQVLEEPNAVPREKVVAAYNTIATALDISTYKCIGRISRKECGLTESADGRTSQKER